jgi:hypothetical protein
MKTLQMRNIALTVSFMLVIALTFSCSDDNNNDSGTSSSSENGEANNSSSSGNGSPGVSSSSENSETNNSSSSGNGSSGVSSSSENSEEGGVAFDENSQIFNADGTHYYGSGDIKMRLYNSDSSIYLGSVTNGIVELELPPIISDEYLRDIDSFEEAGCEVSPKDAKIGDESFSLYNNNGDYSGKLNPVDLVEYMEDTGLYENIQYWYFSKAAKIICDLVEDDDDDEYIINIDIDAKAGWNKLYITSKEFSTKNILTKNLNWRLLD